MISLARLEAELEARGLVLPEPAARLLGHSVAAMLAEAHAAEDAAGDLAPIVLGAWSAADIQIDDEGEVTLAHDLDRAPDSAARTTRATPRADVLVLGTVLARTALVSAPDLSDALALACEPVEARRRITAVELEALLARRLELTDARRALVESVRTATTIEERVPISRRVAPGSRPLSPAIQLVVALGTASLVYSAGVAIVDRLLR